MNSINTLSNLLSKRPIQHIFVWTVVIIIEAFTLSESYAAGFLTSNFVLNLFLKILIVIFTTYINYLILIPKFLKRRKYILFTIGNILNISIFSFFIFLVTISSYENVTIHGGDDFEHHIIFTFSILYVVFFIIVSTLIYFAKEWYKLKDIANKLVLSEKEKIVSEHNALKAQLNPHFLFNTLNNIYSFSITKSDKTPEVVLKLSGLMSYILYECKEDYVNIRKEIDFLNNYIELEQIRSKRINIVFNKDIDSPELMIAPLLFIPFVENAFKHSKSSSKDSNIRIGLTTNKNSDLYFYCKNNKGHKSNSADKKYKGVGLRNIKKRLSLLYDKKYDLKITDNKDIFIVELKLKLK